jgi:hypothetical protein
VRAPSRISPATEAIIDTSSSSDGDSGGRIEGSRAASIDLPAPGEPIIRIWWTIKQKSHNDFGWL